MIMLIYRDCSIDSCFDNDVENICLNDFVKHVNLKWLLELPSMFIPYMLDIQRPINIETIT